MFFNFFFFLYSGEIKGTWMINKNNEIYFNEQCNIKEKKLQKKNNIQLALDSFF